jgi:hypothetical protein
MRIPWSNIVSPFPVSVASELRPGCCNAAARSDRCQKSNFFPPFSVLPPSSFLHDSDSHQATQPSPLLAGRQATSTAPRPASTLTPDPWQCITENITQYFDVPKPTGTPFDAIDSYDFDVAARCRATATGRDMLSCTVSDPKSWCSFTTAAPADVLSGYSATYLSVILDG